MSEGYIRGFIVPAASHIATALAGPMQGDGLGRLLASLHIYIS
jgi:hypothetical protein